jgi:hypothetical protein
MPAGTSIAAWWSDRRHEKATQHEGLNPLMIDVPPKAPLGFALSALQFAGARGAEASTAQVTKVFLLLFVHKKKPSSWLGMTCPQPITL